MGKSCSGLQRATSHAIPCRLKNDKTYKGSWIKSLVASGLTPEVDVLEEHETSANLAEAEKFFIAYFRSIGCRLTNLTDGGDGGGAKWSEETRKRHSETTSRPEVKARIAAGQRGKKHSPETNAKRLIGQRKAIAEGKMKPWLGKKMPAEIRAKMSASHLRPETRAARVAMQTGKRASQETRAKMSASHKGKTAKPIVDSMGRTYSSLTEAALVLGLQIANVSSVLSGRRKSTGGLTFTWVS